MKTFFKLVLVVVLGALLGCFVGSGLLLGCAAMRQGAVDGAKDAAAGNPPAPLVVNLPPATPGGPPPAPSTPDLVGHAIVYAIVYGVGTTLKELIKAKTGINVASKGSGGGP